MRYLNLVGSRSSLFALGAVIAAGSFGAAGAHAAALTPGNLVVYRVGDEVGTITNGNNPVFIDEYTLAGTRVQSIPMPATGAASLTAGNATAEGVITLSSDGKYVMLGGYREYSNSTTAPGTVAATTINRVVGRLNVNGTVDTSIALTGAQNSQVFRGATSPDGNSIWTVGGGGNSVAGIRHTTGTLGQTGYSDSVFNGNMRGANLFDGRLYASTSSTLSTTNGSDANRGVFQFNNGAPEFLDSNITRIGTPTVSTSSVQGFMMLDGSDTVPGVDVLYFAENLASVADSFIVKYIKEASGTWTFVGHTALLDNMLNMTAIENADGSAMLVGNSALQIGVLNDPAPYSNTVPTDAFNVIATPVGTSLFRGPALIPVPEPTTVALLALPALALLGRRRRGA